MFMLVLLGIVLCIGFFIYKLGREKGERTAREKMQLHEPGQEHAIPHRDTAESIALQKERSARTHAVRESHHNHNEAIAAGVIGAVAGAALVHHHDESNLQRKLDQLDGVQRAGGNVPYSDFDEDARYDSDDMDYGDDGTDDSDGDMNNDAEDYDASDQDGFDEYGTEDSNDFSDDYGDDDDDGGGF